jgi:hypothetical protein
MVKYERLLAVDMGDDRTSIWINFDALSWWFLHILKKILEENYLVIFSYFFQKDSNWEYVTIVFGVIVAFNPKESCTHARNNGAFQYKLKSIN